MRAGLNIPALITLQYIKNVIIHTVNILLTNIESYMPFNRSRVSTKISKHAIGLIVMTSYIENENMKSGIDIYPICLRAKLIVSMKPTAFKAEDSPYSNDISTNYL